MNQLDLKFSDRSTTGNVIPTNPDTASVPTDEKRPDGQHVSHWVLSEEERKNGWIRPYRQKYKHVGLVGPKNPLRDLTEEEFERYNKFGYIKFEEYPKAHVEETSVTGKFWTQPELDKINNGCGIVTTMPNACAETYAKQPQYYGSTFCCGCNKYLRVGADGEFIWDDGSGERVGT